MTQRKIGAPFTALAMCLALSACGGGGGGSVASTPTTPATGGGTNANLLGPLVSESFANDAAVGQANYGGAFSSSAAASTVAFSYNAANNSYTVSSGGNAASFAPANKDPAQSSARATVYTVTAGSTTDSLTLTNPGTSGAFTYKYVGGGYWQRTTINGSSGTGSLYAFAYGVPTPAASVPRSGSAAYTLDVLGAAAWPDGLHAIGGSGTMAVNFASGGLNLTTAITDVPASGFGTQTYTMTGSGTLSSSANSFSGTTFVTGYVFQGNFNGRFYGPTAEEVGASFTASGQGISLAGTLLGRAVAAGSGIAGAAGAYTNNTGRLLVYTVDKATGLLTAQAAVSGPGSFGYPTVTLFSASTAPSYTVLDSEGGQVTFNSANQASADAVFTNYTKSATGQADELKLFNPGAGNTSVAMTYASFGLWRTTVDNGATAKVYDRSFAYGQRTDASLMPTSGTAGYNGIVYGRGGGAAGSADLYELNGTTHLDVNFGTGAITSTMNSTLRNTATSATTTLPQYSLTGGISSGTNSFWITTDGSNPTIVNVNGNFYGPLAREIAGTMFLQGTVNGQPLAVAGAMVAK